MEGVSYLEDFLEGPQSLFDELEHSVVWDERMRARKTASFGVAYNYSQIEYPVQAFPKVLLSVIADIYKLLGFEPNNCLINFYPDGESKMGFHSDQTDILAPDTGIAIVSLGSTRVLRFRDLPHKTETIDYNLVPGSLLYMTQEVQSQWQHALPKASGIEGRMSLTFRKIIS